MHWRDEAEHALARPRPDEPRNLRVDILDEIADHLALAAERERERGLKSEEAVWKAVLEKFGNPAIVVQQMWWESMRGIVMKQRTLQMLLILGGGIVGVVIAFSLWAIIGKQYEFYPYIVGGFSAGTLPVLVILALLQSPQERPILRMIFNKTLWKRIAVGAAVALVAASVVIAILNFFFARKLDALTEDMKARGVIVDLKSLATTRPEGTVFYDGPWESSLYGFLFSAEAGGDYQHPENAQRVRRLRRQAEAGGDFQHPENAQPTKWSWSIYKTDINLADIFSTEDPETIDMIRAAVMEQQEFITRLKSLAAQPPVSPEMMHEHNMNYDTLRETPIPNLIVVRNLANLLAMDASVKWRDGDEDGALEDCEAIIQLGRHIADQPNLLSGMLAMALGRIAVQAMADMGINTNYSNAAIACIDPLLANAFEQNLIAKSLRGEVFVVRQIFREVDGFYGFPLFNAWRGHDEMTFLRIMAAAIEQNMLPFYEQTGEPEALADTLDWRTPISNAIITDFLRCRRQVTEMRAKFVQARIALALTRYKRDTGAYPATLDALAPTCLTEIPEDPFSGNTMLYRVGPEGYLLSSVGWNGQDDVLKTDRNPPLGVYGFSLVPSDDVVWCPMMNKLWKR